MLEIIPKKYFSISRLEIVVNRKCFSISLTNHRETHGDSIQQPIHCTTFKIHWEAIILLMETRDKMKLFKYSSSNIVLT